ncbi:MAG: O-antigen ligase family protein [Nitrosomonadales bacterium]|nr:O-antigen ligase family protein [Nitrosomonadales bacterium]
MGTVHSRYLFFVEKTAALLLLIYPALMLTVKGGMNGTFLLMLLLTFAVWIVRPAGINAVKWQPEWKAYFVAMVAMSAAIFVSQSYHHNYDAHPHDAASRYWLAIPVFLLLHRLRMNIFIVLQFAFPVAAITGLWLAKDLGGRSGIGTLDLIRFGNFELILGALSLFSINWFGRDRLPLRILKISGFAAGLAASLASGSRGGWLAIPVFIAIFFYFRMTRISLKMAAASLISTILAFTIAYTGSATVHQRVNALANDVASFGQGNLDTSIGIRWQLYQAAVDVFSRHPIFGVGPEGFALEMKPMMEAGKITPLAAGLGHGEVHSDILSKATGMGVFGLLAILAVYFVPFRLFWKATKSSSAQVKRAGVLGVTFVSGIFMFGLTVEVLNLTMSTAFYSFTVAVLLAACYNTHHGK